MVDKYQNKTKINRKIDLNNIFSLSISSNTDADIVLNTDASGLSFLIRNVAEEVRFVVLNSDGEIFVNNVLFTEKECIIEDYDYIKTSGIDLYYSNHFLFFSDENVVNSPKSSLILESNSDEYPLFVRNARVKAHIDEEKISILNPESLPEKPEVNILTSLLPAIVMLGLTIVFRGILNTSKSTFVIMSICSMGMGVISSVVSLVGGQKKYKKRVKERRRKYIDYIECKREEISKARQEELECLKCMYYSTQEDIDHIMHFDTCLFDKIEDDDDFLEVYLGIGVKPALKKIDVKKQESLDTGDELSSLPERIATQYKYISGAPITVKIKDANVVGVIGDEKKLFEMFKCILVDLVSRHYFGDLHLFAIIGEDNIQKYEFLKYIPHFINDAGFRNIVCDAESRNIIFENLYKEFEFRSGVKNSEGHNVVFVLDEMGIKSHPISRYIEHAAELNTTFIFFETKREYLPLYCSSFIIMGEENEGIIYETENKTNCSKFSYYEVENNKLLEAFKILTPVFCEEITLEGSLRKSISLFELLEINNIEELNLRARWEHSEIYKSMAVPLGVNSKDEIVYLNLHEKFHGPHGLVAGTTGSGKSEILQSYILGAASLFHPYEIGFVIIDFKGGGMVNQFKNLPHLIGAITNIDGKAIDRSLKSIKAELLKRQALFAAAEVNHIDKYIKLFKEGKVTTALPHLIIVVDEFAELKAEQPEFMKELISAARIGRSLGVHLILATQKPAGQVNEQIWSNSKFKLCLKVQTKEDSNEVLKSPLAAEIREPGRAYLQVGNNEMFELLQSGFSGAPEKMNSQNKRKFQVHDVDFKGTRRLIFKQESEKSSDSRTQLEAIVDYVHEYCENSCIKKLNPICLPALPEHIAFQPSANNTGLAVGIYDDPDHQRQEVAMIPYDENIIIIGSAQMGKTNLLMTIIRRYCELYSPDELSIYILDFSSMILKNFEKLAYVGGVVCASEDEKLGNFFRFLSDEIDYRRKKLVEKGVSSFSSYVEAGNVDLARFVVILDNYAMLKELYPNENEMLGNLLREGMTVGITFIMTNSIITGVGFKILSNISYRMAFYSNDSSVFVNLFGRAKYCPDEIPGRCVLSLAKEVYETQIFVGFSGEKEIERVQGIHSWIDDMNAKYPGKKAIRIPEIPDVLYASDLRDVSDDVIRLGLSYGEINQISINPMRSNELTIVGRSHAGKTNFIKHIIKEFSCISKDGAIYIFDDYNSKYKDYTNANRYTKDIAQALSIITEIGDELASEYSEMMKGAYKPTIKRLIILNDMGVLEAIAKDKTALAVYKDIVGKYKNFGLLLLITCLEDAAIGVIANDIAKHVKETKNIIAFDDITDVKICDVGITVARTFKKKIVLGDAYYIHNTEVIKLKTPLCECS